MGKKEKEEAAVKLPEKNEYTLFLFLSLCVFSLSFSLSLSSLLLSFSLLASQPFTSLLSSLPPAPSPSMISSSRRPRRK